MSKKRTIREVIMTVVDTVELHNPKYNFTSLRQAADRLATYYESKKDSEAEFALNEFLERIPLGCTHSTKDITDYIGEKGYFGQTGIVNEPN